MSRVFHIPVAVILPFLFGCAHVGGEAVEQVGEHSTGGTRNERVGSPQIRIISQPTPKSPVLRLAAVRSHTIEREYTPIFGRVRKYAPYSLGEEFDEQCWGCVFLPLNVGKAFVFFLFDGFWRENYERYSPFVNVDPKHYPEREILDTEKGAPVWRAEMTDETLPPPAGPFMLNGAPIRTECIAASGNAISIDLAGIIKDSPGRSWVVSASDPRLEKPFLYRPTGDEIEAFEFAFGREAALANSSEASKLRRFAARALDAGDHAGAMKFLERAAILESDVDALLDIAVFAAPHCSAVVKTAVAKTGFEIPDRVGADGLFLAGAALSAANEFEIAGRLFDVIEDRAPMNGQTVVALLVYARGDVLRGVTYAHALNRLDAKKRRGNEALLAYAVAKEFANINPKISILKDAPENAAKKWNDALSLFKSADFADAAKLFGELLIDGRRPPEAANNRAVCFWRLAEAAFGAGDLAAARADVRLMVEACPTLPRLEETLSEFFAAAGMAEIAKDEPDFTAALSDLRAAVRVSHNRESAMALVLALWRVRKIGAASRWAQAVSRVEPDDALAAALAEFASKIEPRDFDAARGALDKLRKTASEGNESVLAELFAHELEWKAYVAVEEKQGRSYKDIISDAQKYRAMVGGFRDAASRLKSTLPHQGE